MEDYLDLGHHLAQLYDMQPHEHIPRQIRDRSNPMEEFGDDDFFVRFRFDKDTVRYICDLVIVNLQRRQDHTEHIPPLLQLLMTLRYYASGTFQIVVGDLLGVHQSTVSRVVKRTSEALARHCRDFVRFPENAAGIRAVQRGFYNIAGFPGAFGTIDCTHVPIQSPGGRRAELFRNRKGWFSINVQVVGDAQLKMMNIIARWPGSTHDARIFDNSAIRAAIEHRNIPGYLLADNGYPCRAYMLTPFLNPANNHEERYNFCHSQTRTSIERLFGLWKRRFPCLRNGLRNKLQTSLTIIVACAVLHNIARTRMVQVPDGEGDFPADFDQPRPDVQRDRHGFAARRAVVTQHFTR